MPYALGSDAFEGRQPFWDDHWNSETLPFDRGAYRDLGLHTGIAPPDLGVIPYHQRDDEVEGVVPPKDIPDIAHGRWSGDVLVSLKVRKIIEEMDPVQHFYTPVELHTLDGKTLSDFFIFTIGDFVEALDIKRSYVTVSSRFPVTNEIRRVSFGGQNAALYWRKKSLEGRHIWVDKMETTYPFISDDLHHRFKSEGIGYYEDSWRTEFV